MGTGFVTEEAKRKTKQLPNGFPPQAQRQESHHPPRIWRPAYNYSRAKRIMTTQAKL